MIIAYITYRLLFLEGIGHQPYHQVASLGFKFEGGMMGINGRMMGYLHGKGSEKDEEIDEVVSALSAWDARRITKSEAMVWSDNAVPEGTVMEGMPGVNTVIVGKATSDLDGRIVKQNTEIAYVAPK